MFALISGDQYIIAFLDRASVLCVALVFLMCSVTDKPTVNMDRIFAFRQSDGTIWRLRLRFGQWFEYRGDQWQRVDEGYLKQHWYLEDGHWLILKNPRDTWNTTQWFFYTLAFEVLPEWNMILDRADKSRDIIKQWSHHGQTRLGDVGNKSMAMTLQLCHRIRSRLGAGPLYQFTGRKAEKAADQLEAIMGFRVAVPESDQLQQVMRVRELDPRWRAAGHYVDHCCSVTYRVWYEHWDDDVAQLSDRLGLSSLVEGLSTWDDIQSRARTGTGVRVALYRKLRIECVMRQIMSYCF